MLKPLFAGATLLLLLQLLAKLWRHRNRRIVLPQRPDPLPPWVGPQRQQVPPLPNEPGPDAPPVPPPNRIVTSAWNGKEEV